MKEPESKPARVYLGKRAFREKLFRCVAQLREGTITVLRDRNKVEIGALVPPEFLALGEQGERLPNAYYAAYFLQREAMTSLAEILADVSPAIAQKIVDAAMKIAAQERPKNKPAKKPQPEQKQLDLAPPEEPADLKEERIRATAKARTKAAIELREKEKLAQFPDIKPTPAESLSIRHLSEK